MKITKYRNGIQSYDFDISRENLLEFFGMLLGKNMKGGIWWLHTDDKELIKFKVKG